MCVYVCERVRDSINFVFVLVSTNVCVCCKIRLSPCVCARVCVKERERGVERCFIEGIAVYKK